MFFYFFIISDNREICGGRRYKTVVVPKMNGKTRNFIRRNTAIKNGSKKTTYKRLVQC